MSAKNQTTTFTDVSQLQKVCRSCLCELHKEYFWLESYYLEEKILDIYQNVIAEEIDPNHELPQKLCFKCYNCLIKFHLFKNKVLHSEDLLKKTFYILSTTLCDETKSEEHIEMESSEYYVVDDYSNNLANDSCSEDEKSILERLQNDTKTENNQNVDSTEALIDNDNKPEVLQIRPKAKFKKRLVERRNSIIDKKEKRGRTRLSCIECGKQLFAYKMDNHMRTHTKEKPYGCEKCGAHFAEKSNLNRHVKIHGNDRPHKCALCGKGFIRPSIRAIHEMTAHISEKNILCPICNKAFKHQYFLKKHMSNIHNKAELKVKVERVGYPCPICGNNFSTKSSLKVHRMKHDQPKAFLCNICGNGYSTKASLENHQKVHTGEKNLSCHICNKKFRFIATLKTHVLVHSGEKPLSCPLCHKQFRQHAHLNTHMRGQHSTARPYQCSFCSKTFKQSCNLRVHTRIHTGETPYHCDICQKGFYDSSGMKKHRKGHFVKDASSLKNNSRTDITNGTD